jgi:formate hydrogenlyase subunit 3/multisubunit Na+/H+ antiporter MnhD subunit
MVSTQAPLLSTTTTLMLTVMAIISALGCAAGAIGAGRLRSMLGWHASSQFAMVVLMALSDVRILVLGVPLLIVSGIISTIMIALAIAFVEVRSNTDELSQLRPHASIGMAGVIILIAVASSIGLPGTLGFIARWWVIEVIFAQAPWILVAMLVVGSMQGLAWSVVLASIWRRSPRTLRATPLIVSAIPNWGAWLGATCFAVLLLGLGIFPNLVWQRWVTTLQKHFAIDAVITQPTMPTLWQQLGLAGMALLIVVVPLIASRTAQRSQLGASDQQSVAVTPIATAESMSLLTGIVKADGILHSAWQALIRIGQAIQWILKLGEERYYVAGLVMGLIVIVLLLI